MPLLLNGTTGVSGVDGAAGTPAAQGSDTNTGVFYGTDTVSISTGGTARVVVNSDGQTVLGAGTASLPALSTTGDLNTGTFYPAADTIGWTTGGSERARISSGGVFSVNTTDVSARFTLAADLGSMAMNISNGASDGTGYGVLQVAKPGTNNTMHYISFIRTGNAVAGIGFAQNSNTFVIVNGNTNTNNGVTLTQGGTSWGTQSDERLKTDLVPIENAIEKVKKLRTVTGRFKNDPVGKSRSFFIAQDFDNVFEEAMDKSDPDKLTVQYSDTNPLLAAAIKELSAKLDAAEARIAALEAK